MRFSLIAVAGLIQILLICLPASAAPEQTEAISVISSPQPADVYVNGTHVGQTNNAFVNIPGRYAPCR